MKEPHVTELAGEEEEPEVISAHSEHKRLAAENTWLRHGYWELRQHVTQLMKDVQNLRPEQIKELSKQVTTLRQEITRYQTGLGSKKKSPPHQEAASG